MNTSSEAVKNLEQAGSSLRAAVDIINNLIVEHDYQDVASLVASAAVALAESASYLMQSKDEAALEALDRADDFLDSVWEIIEADTAEDE